MRSFKEKEKHYSIMQVEKESSTGKKKTRRKESYIQVQWHLKGIDIFAGLLFSRTIASLIAGNF